MHIQDEKSFQKYIMKYLVLQMFKFSNYLVKVIFLCPRHTVPIFIHNGHPNAKIVSSYEVGPDLVKIPKSDRSKYDE